MVSTEESVAMVRGFLGLYGQYLEESTPADALTALVSALAIAASENDSSEVVVDFLERCPVDVIATLVRRP